MGTVQGRPRQKEVELPAIILRHEAETFLKDKDRAVVNPPPSKMGKGTLEVSGRVYNYEPEQNIPEPIVEIVSNTHSGLTAPNSLAEDLVYMRLAMRKFIAENYPGKNLMVLDYRYPPQHLSRQVAGGHIQLSLPSWYERGMLNPEKAKDTIRHLREGVLPFIATGTEPQRIARGGPCEVAEDYVLRLLDSYPISLDLKHRILDAGFIEQKGGDVILSTENRVAAEGRDPLLNVEVRVVPAGPWVPKDALDIVSAVHSPTPISFEYSALSSLAAAEEGYSIPVRYGGRTMLLRDAYRTHVSKNSGLYGQAIPQIRELVSAAANNGLSFNAFRNALYGMFPYLGDSDQIIDAVNIRMGVMDGGQPRKLSLAMQDVASDLANPYDAEKVRALSLFLTYSPRRVPPVEGVSFSGEGGDSFTALMPDKGLAMARVSGNQSYLTLVGEEQAYPFTVKALVDGMRGHVHEKTTLYANIKCSNANAVKALLDNGFILKGALQTVRGEDFFMMEYRFIQRPEDGRE